MFFHKYGYTNGLRYSSMMANPISQVSRSLVFVQTRIFMLRYPRSSSELNAWAWATSEKEVQLRDGKRKREHDGRWPLTAESRVGSEMGGVTSSREQEVEYVPQIMIKANISLRNSLIYQKRRKVARKIVQIKLKALGAHSARDKSGFDVETDSTS